MQGHLTSWCSTRALGTREAEEEEAAAEAEEADSAADADGGAVRGRTAEDAAGWAAAGAGVPGVAGEEGTAVSRVH